MRRRRHCECTITHYTCSSRCDQRYVIEHIGGVSTDILCKYQSKFVKCAFNKPALKAACLYYFISWLVILTYCHRHVLMGVERTFRFNFTNVCSLVLKMELESEKPNAAFPCGSCVSLLTFQIIHGVY